MSKYFYLVILIFTCHIFVPIGFAKNFDDAPIQIGASRLSDYLPLLAGKRVGLALNHTSMIGQTHILDTLLSHKINIVRVFGPEHGFRGDAGAGETVKSEIDPKTGIEIVSLYGSGKKPTDTQLNGLDIIVFDMQDVGARFYTYISTMHYLMEACARQNILFVVLDRPNPMGSLVDGPVLDTSCCRSFVGMHPIPLVHGLTVGELARMINGECWLKGAKTCPLTVISCLNYKVGMSYWLSVPPSPNLPNQVAVWLYPSLCLFEGTKISVGRGTDFPFTVIGAPMPEYGDFYFVPRSIAHAAPKPMYLGRLCYGKDLRKETDEPIFTLEFLIKMYEKSPEKDKFFIDFFDKLAGTSLLRKQIKAGISERYIRKTWKKDLKYFKKQAEPYLIYERL